MWVSLRRCAAWLIDRGPRTTLDCASKRRYRRLLGKERLPDTPSDQGLDDATDHGGRSIDVAGTASGPLESAAAGAHAAELLVRCDRQGMAHKPAQAAAMPIDWPNSVVVLTGSARTLTARGAAQGSAASGPARWSKASEMNLPR